MVTQQKTFCSSDYGGDNKKAIKARNEWLKKKKLEGYQTRGSAIGNQLRRSGGIGTKKPDKEYWTKCYMGTAWK